MAARDLTHQYELLRKQKRRFAPHTIQQQQQQQQQLSGGVGADSQLIEGLVHAPPANYVPPPEWVQIVDNINKDILNMKESLRSLSKQYATRLKVSFGDEVISEQEREIEILVANINTLLRRSEANVKKIAAIGNTGKLTDQERTVRLNVMRAFATDLTALSKSFKHQQREFLKNLRDQEQIGDKFFSASTSDSQGRKVTFDDAINEGLTENQAREMEMMHQQANDREKEIIRIAQSINELASIFKELSVLVIAQGTIVDRIDYNIEKTTIKVASGTEHLKKAEEHNKKSHTVKCIVILCAVVLILLIVFIYKKSNSSSS